MKLNTVLAALCLSVCCFLSCEKEGTETPAKYPIAGLWIGTYKFGAQPPLYFSFTIYPDGSMSYKSKGVNDYTFYANGTWTLTGNSFTYSVTLVNNPTDPQPVQTGTATFSDDGKLTNGSHTEPQTGATSTFSMNRVN